MCQLELRSDRGDAQTNTGRSWALTFAGFALQHGKDCQGSTKATPRLIHPDPSHKRMVCNRKETQNLLINNIHL